MSLIIVKAEDNKFIISCTRHSEFIDYDIKLLKEGIAFSPCDICFEDKNPLINHGRTTNT